jgi:hypothetical protein
MAEEVPEIPESRTPDEKRVALTIAILAVVLSFVGNLGDNAKTEAVIKTNEASNQWGYFQAKGIKGQLSAMQGELLSAIAAEKSGDKIAQRADGWNAESKRYEDEKAGIKKRAEELGQEAARCGLVNDRCDHASLLLQVAVVLCSVSILSGWRPFWWMGIGLGGVGAILGVSAFLI